MVHELNKPKREIVWRSFSALSSCTKGSAGLLFQGEVMNEAVKAKILNLSASILMGKTDKKEIEQVSLLARENGESAFFQQEIRDCDRILRKMSKC